MRLAKVFLNQPTRGLDLGAINNIHSTVLKARAEGLPALLISTELSEIFACRIGSPSRIKGDSWAFFAERIEHGAHGLLWRIVR